MTKVEAIPLLKERMNVYASFSDEEWGTISKGFELIKFKRKEIITRQGKVEKYLYFVLDGIQRSYYHHHDKEYTLQFTYKGSFSGIPDSLIWQQPSKVWLETLTPSTMLRIPFQKFEKLTHQYRSVEKWRRMEVESTMSGFIQKHIELQSFNSEDRFTILLKRSPHLLNQIPNKYLASYLGMSSETFSRLLNNLKV